MSMTIGRAGQPVAGGALPVRASAGPFKSRAAKTAVESRGAEFINQREIIMSSVLLTAPAVEPLSLAEAKAFLRVEHTDDDDIIAALISASRIHVETQTRRALITQSWRIAADAWPVDGRLPARPGPLRNLAAARVYDFNGVARAIDTGSFLVDAGASVLAFAPWALPSPGRLAAGIELDVVAGYGDAASDVPEPLRQAVRLLVTHWYENRGLASPSAVTILPTTVAALIAPYRMLSL
jgi:uncharacterized phiE125 gp8 family phage protein